MMKAVPRQRRRNWYRHMGNVLAYASSHSELQSSSNLRIGGYVNLDL